MSLLVVIRVENVKLARLPLVASGDVHIHHPDRSALLDVVSAIRMRQSIQLAGRLLFSNREKYLRNYATLSQLYPAGLLNASVHIADLCQFSLDELRYEYPEELVPPGLTSSQYLRQLTEHGVKKRWPAGEPGHVRELIDHPLVCLSPSARAHSFVH